MPITSQTVVALILSLAAAAAVRAADDAAPDFVCDVRPILERSCGSCHAGELPKSGLRLDVKAAAFHGGDGWGPAILPGKPDESPLVRFVRGDEEGMRMPPADSAVEPLSAAEIATTETIGSLLQSTPSAKLETCLVFL